MTYNNIALRISGTKERKGGFAPLAMSGIFPKEEELGLDRAMTGCEGLGFVVKHTPDYSFYMAIDCRVRSFDAQASGVLTIAVTLPARMRLADGKTPYDLLTELHSLFVEKYMTDNGDGRHVFQNVSVNSEPFKELLGHYSLEPVDRAVITMSPTGVTGKLNIPHSYMREFFSDTYYPEFKSFKDIEVGDGLQTSVALRDVTVPRRVFYKVYINGKYIAETPASDLHRDLQMVDPGDKRYSYVPFIFTLQELKENGGYLQRDGATVRLDTLNDRVDCELHRFLKTYKVNVRLGDGTNLQRAMLKNWLENKELTVRLKDKNSGVSSAYVDKTDAVVSDSLVLTYDQLQNAEFEIVPDKGDEYEVRCSYRSSDNPADASQLDIKLTKIVKPAPKPAADLHKQNNPKSGQPKAADNTRYDDRLYSGDAYHIDGSGNSRGSGNSGNGNGDAYAGNPKMIASEETRDSKVKNISLLLIGLVIGIGIGYCVDNFLLSHEPTKAQVEKIQAAYRQTVINEVADSIGDEIYRAQYAGSEEEMTTPTADTQRGASAGNQTGNANKASGANGNSASGAQTANVSGANRASTAQGKAASPNIEQLKKEAVDAFNSGNLAKFQKLCSENPQLEKYKEPGSRILQLLFTQDTRKKTSLKLENFLDDRGNRGEASKVTSLDQLNNLRSKVENAIK